MYNNILKKHTPTPLCQKTLAGAQLGEECRKMDDEERLALGDGEEYLRIVFDPVIRPLLLKAVEVRTLLAFSKKHNWSVNLMYMYRISHRIHSTGFVKC